MKRFLFCIYASVLLFACNNVPVKGDKATATDSLINSAGATVPDEYKTGAELITKNDCLGCHQLDKQNIGPSYNDVSAKYTFDPGIVDNLSHSIIYGSKGLYGVNVMPPHPNISIVDAKAMAGYILSLKNQDASQTEK
ncbi:hypothetical protein BH11BAC6_BH11BAC6_16660 [soil metagenome]